jgi:hypothetical protein
MFFQKHYTIDQQVCSIVQHLTVLVENHPLYGWKPVQLNLYI